MILFLPSYTHINTKTRLNYQGRQTQLWNSSIIHLSIFFSFSIIFFFCIPFVSELTTTLESLCLGFEKCKGSGEATALAVQIVEAQWKKWSEPSKEVPCLCTAGVFMLSNTLPLSTYIRRFPSLLKSLKGEKCPCKQWLRIHPALNSSEGIHFFPFTLCGDSGLGRSAS